jgi:hypothetical protein
MRDAYFSMTLDAQNAWSPAVPKALAKIIWFHECHSSTSVHACSLQHIQHPKRLGIRNIEEIV